MKAIVLILPVVLLASGCFHARHSSRHPAEPTIAISENSAPINATSPNAAASHQALFAQSNGMPAPSGAVPAPDAIPVRIQETVRRVDLAGGIDENGNAFGPQVMWVRQEGRWNLDAINNPSKAFIPPDMTTQMPEPAAVVTTHAGIDANPQAVKSLRDLYDIKDLIVTCFVERAQEPLVLEQGAKYQVNYFHYFDDAIGWIWIPKSVLQHVRPD